MNTTVRRRSPVLGRSGAVPVNAPEHAGVEFKQVSPGVQSMLKHMWGRGRVSTTGSWAVTVNAPEHVGVKFKQVSPGVGQSQSMLKDMQWVEFKRVSRGVG